MAKISKEEEWRRSGMAYALKIAREKGIEGLEQEIKFRNITKCPISISKEKAIEFFEEDKRNCVVSFSLLTLLTLHDEYGFNKKRLERFWKRFNLKSECIIEGYTDWQETQQMLLDDCKMKIELPEALINFNKMME